MSFLYSYATMLQKIQNDYDLINEPFVSSTELVGYFNEAIETAETAVNTLGIEDTYLLATDFINLNTAQATYNLPADIYANKIRKMFYSNPVTNVVTTATLVQNLNSFTVANASGLSQGMSVFGTGIPQTTKITSVNGTTITVSNAATVSGSQTLTFVSMIPLYGARRYEVRKIRNLMDTLYFYPGDDYRFLIVNSQQSEGGNQLQIYPPPNESGPLIQLWYIREMRRLTTSTSDSTNVCEVPECTNFIFAHVKWNLEIKRRNGNEQRIAFASAERDKQYALMEETLKEMVPDENNKVQCDFSAYYNQELDLYY